jgi:hypothetical protein
MKRRLLMWLVVALIANSASLRIVQAQSVTTLDPSLFTPGQDISNAFAGVTLSTMSLVPDGTDPHTGISISVPSFAPVYAAGSFFSPSSTGSSTFGEWGPYARDLTDNCFQGCSSQGGSTLQSMLLVDFNSPVSMVSVFQIANDFNGEMLQAFDSADQLLGYCFPSIGDLQPVGNYGCYSVLNNNDFQHTQVETSFTASNISKVLVGGYNTADQIGAIEVVRAPEIDPTSAASGLTLLMGGLVVLRGRKKLDSAAA